MGIRGSPGTPGGPTGSGGSAGPTTTTNNGPDTRIQDGLVWIKDIFTGEWIVVGNAPKDDAAGAGRGTSQSSGSSFSGQYVNDALTAAGQAIQAFLSGQSLADARKLAAAEQFQSMAAWALPGGELPGGFEEGGAMQQLAAMAGRPTYTAPSRDFRTVNPGALEHPGQVSPGVMDFIDQLLGAVGKGGVVTTGGSSQQSSSS